ncbi:DUF2867 domain-containing protein [Mycobacterium sp.]|uniref:DUF2867 domain-containing protein n=1 Tax=Mycobacterium sp. TaxID=1785 RepID=UPI0025E6B9CF|nr:DUF2867 domain-containing protein [Mycobacterium sp.]
MERLPYIDEHAISIAATRAETWPAVLKTICRDPDDPSTVPLGFVLDEARPPERLALKGRHLFARYLWVFELDTDGPRRTRVRSATWAHFPGFHGKIYRALVIGTGAHRVVVRATLKRISSRALANRTQLHGEAADYVDVFEVPMQSRDTRTAEQALRDALGAKPSTLGAAVLWIHRHILGFRLGPDSSPTHVIGWSIVRSDDDEVVLEANGPLMHGELDLRRHDQRRAVLTTRLHYRHRFAGRAVWLIIGPLHRATAPQLMKRTARVAV